MNFTLKCSWIIYQLMCKFLHCYKKECQSYEVLATFLKMDQNLHAIYRYRMVNFRGLKISWIAQKLL